MSLIMMMNQISYVMWMKYMERLFGNIYQVVENPNEESAST